MIQKALRFCGSGGKQGCAVPLPQVSVVPPEQRLQSDEAHGKGRNGNGRRKSTKSSAILPTTTAKHWALKQRGAQEALADLEQSRLSGAEVTAIVKFQRIVQRRQLLRMAGRAYEFDAWHVECKSMRTTLKAINIVLLFMVAGSCRVVSCRSSNSVFMAIANSNSDSYKKESASD